jgi:NAD-dependent deacetylase
MVNNIVQNCTNLIRNAKNIVVLTGAGISTESGIKDFRSSTGIYSSAPEYLLSIDYFYKHPKEFYDFAIANLYHPKADPNKGHMVLAKWEMEGKVNSVITQNIDELHQKAGSQNVIEFHGTMKTTSCQNCRKIYSTEEMLNRMDSMEDFFVCSDCITKHAKARYIKPDVVLYGDAGEWFTQEGFNTFLNKIHEADCVLVLGTSLKVTPFSNFPRYKREGVPLIIINKGDTPYDNQPDTYVIQESIGETLNQIDEHLNK